MAENFNMSNTTEDLIMSISLDEVYESSLVDGTDNIYMREKKYILPIENLDNSTYDVQ